MKGKQLPTFSSATWTVTALLDSLKLELSRDTRGKSLNLFAYAATLPGWQAVRSTVLNWVSLSSGRTVRCYVGTDHGLTDPDALRHLERDHVEVRMMTTYSGIYHPKVFWLFGPRKHLIWVGSNNLTRDGLRQNVEFSTLIKSTSENAELKRWFEAVHAASEPLTEELLSNYENERRAFAASRAGAGTFTWSKRKEPASARNATTRRRRTGHLPQRRGDLVIEIMPLETGLDGKQIQLPKAAAVRFFGLDDLEGASRQISLTPIGTTARRNLTLTLFGNNTTRLSINELDYRDRPCVILFHRTGPDRFQFEIVQRSIFPDRFRVLLARCTNQTRAGSRRWTFL